MMHPYMRNRWVVQLLRQREDGYLSIRVLGYVTAPTPEIALAKAVEHWPAHRGHLAIPTFGE